MVAFSEEARAKSNAVQRQKYGKDYSAEMRRRASLRKTHGFYNYFGYLKEHDPDRFKQIIADREANRRAKSKKAVDGKDFAEVQDRTQEE